MHAGVEVGETVDHIAHPGQRRRACGVVEVDPRPRPTTEERDRQVDSGEVLAPLAGVWRCHGRPKSNPYSWAGRACIAHTRIGVVHCVIDTRLGVKSEAPDSSLAARELNFLVRLAQAAASTQRPDELLELIIRETTSAIGTDVCSLYLLTPPGLELLLTATNGLNENMVGRVTMKVGEGITGWVAESRRPAVVPDVSKEPHWKWVPGLDEDRFHSMASVPIESGPRLVGVLNVQSTERREFDSGDIDFLRAIAAQVAGILERSELQRRTEVQLAEIRLSHDIHERFTKLSLDGAGIRLILEVIGSLAGGRAALYSGDGYRVRGAGEHSDGMPQRIHVPAIGASAREVRINAGRPARPLDVVPVRAGAETLALLAVGVDEESVDPEGRLRALEHGSTVLALELSKERAAAEVERRLRGDLVEEVLAGGLEPDEAERIARQAERLGHRMQPGARRLISLPGRVPSPARGAEPRRPQPFRQRAARAAPSVRAVARHTTAGNSRGAVGGAMDPPRGGAQPGHPHQLDDLSRRAYRVADRPEAGRRRDAGRNLDRPAGSRDARRLGSIAKKKSPGVSRGPR